MSNKYTEWIQQIEREQQRHEEENKRIDLLAKTMQVPLTLGMRFCVDKKDIHRVIETYDGETYLLNENTSKAYNLHNYGFILCVYRHFSGHDVEQL